MSTIKENWERFNDINKMKEERDVPFYRCSGRTTRSVFDLASRTPEGHAYFVSDNMAQSNHARQLFIDIMTYTGAPITLNRNDIVIMGKTRYRFISDSQYYAFGFRESLTENDEVVYNHSTR